MARYGVGNDNMVEGRLRLGVRHPHGVHIIVIPQVDCLNLLISCPRFPL